LTKTAPANVAIDVGDTTTDIGMLKNGFPREANNIVEVGGVRTLFRMPDLLSIALGGGTVIHRKPLQIGPDNTGYQLLQRGLVFGGEELTATDVAVAAGQIELGDPSRVANLPAAMIDAAMAEMREMVAVAIDRMKVDAGTVPLLAVGGGAFLVPEQLPGVSHVIHVEHGSVANSVGGAIARFPGNVTKSSRGCPAAR
jgi:N-methylhydantoinase A/oxoprolinase/acetone carboxylase beta subunit